MSVDEDAGEPLQQPSSGGAWTPEQIAAIRARADALGYRTPTALSKAMGISHPTVMRWYSGERGASMRMQRKLAAVLGWPWPTDFLLPPDAGEGDATQRTVEAGGVLSPPSGGRYGAGGAGAEGAGRRDVPVYRAGSRTDPVAPEARAAADDWVALLEADERVLGRRGFGIRVVDESLSHWTVARGDVLWFDPDWPAGGLANAPEEGVLVAALLPCGELAARVLRRGELVTDGVDRAEAVPFTPELYRGRNVGRMKPIDRPRRQPTGGDDQDGPGAAWGRGPVRLGAALALALLPLAGVAGFLA